MNVSQFLFLNEILWATDQGLTQRGIDQGAVITDSVGSFELGLLGTFRLTVGDGKRIEIASKRGIALIAMLAMARDGECTRAWLQDKLWSQRQKSQSQASLRRELSNLRKCLGQYADNLLETDHQLVRLNLENVSVDARADFLTAKHFKDREAIDGEFLAGLDLAGEEGFEDWLREQRRIVAVEMDDATVSGFERIDLVPRRTSIVISIAAIGQILSEVFRDGIAALTEEHGGWIFRTDESGIIIACTTADQALKLAIAIRQYSADVAAIHDVDEILRLRFGIGAGGLQQEEDSRKGSAVDVAVGLQQAARTSGMIVSKSVYDTLTELPDLIVVGHGQMEVAATVLPVVSLQFELENQSSGRLPSHILDINQPARGFENRPALAVLPLENVTGGEVNEYIADGISEELINRLSRLRWLPVIARSSSFSFRNEKTDLTEIGAKLGAKYVLEGHLRTVGRQYLVSVNLSDVGSGHTLFSHRLELPPEYSQDSIDELTAELVAALDARIDRAEQLRAREKKPGQLDVNDLIWRGRWHLNRLTRENSARAQELFAEALALEPESSEALIQVTFCLTWSIWAGREPASQIDEMRRMAQQAILADVDDGRGYLLAGVAEMWLRQPLRARALIEQAIELNPSLAMAYAQLGGSYNLTGEPELALGPLTTSMRLSPNDMHIFYSLGELAMANNFLGHWASAIELADQAITRRPAYWYAHMIKITALARSGDIAAAGFAYDELLERKPDFSLKYVQWLPFVNEEQNTYFIDGLALVPTERPNRIQQNFVLAEE